MAIYSPHTGVVDFGKVARSYGEDFKQNGGKLVLGFQVGTVIMCLGQYNASLYYI